MQNGNPLAAAQGVEKRTGKRSGQSASRQGAASQGASGNLLANSNNQFSIDTK